MATNGDDDTKNTATSKRRDRSPNFPSIGFAKALGFAQKIWTGAKRHPMPLDVLVKQMGYNAPSGATNPIVATLKQYGLIQPEGKDLRVTDEAHFIFVHDDESDPDRMAMIRKVALRPPLFRDVLERYDNELPAEVILRAKLQMDYGFASADSANTFIKVLREAVDAAGGADAVSEARGSASASAEPSKEAPANYPPATTIQAAITSQRPASSAAAPATPRVDYGGVSREWNLGGDRMARIALPPDPTEDEEQAFDDYYSLLKQELALARKRKARAAALAATSSGKEDAS